MLVLASQSPRRSEILRQAGIPFTVRPVEVDETPLAGESPRAYVERLALAKALAAPAGPQETVLAADTTVTIDGALLGKPARLEPFSWWGSLTSASSAEPRSTHPTTATESGRFLDRGRSNSRIGRTTQDQLLAGAGGRS